MRLTARSVNSGLEWGVAALFMTLLVGLLVRPAAFAESASLASAAVPAHRVAGRSWWRQALELPEEAMDVFAWPLKRGVIWAERVNLPERIFDVLYFNDERTAGWFPNFSFGGEIQSAAGFRLFHDDLWGHAEEISLATLFAIDDLEEERVEFRFFVPSVAGSRAHVLAHVFYSEDNDEDFFVRFRPDGSFGLGAETGEDDDTTFELDLVRSRFEGGFRPNANLDLGLAFQPIFGDVEEGGGAEPPIPRFIDGFGGPTVLLGGGPYFEWDVRDNAVRPRSGWFARADGGAWADVRGETTSGRDYRYARYRIDLRRYQPTFRRDRVIVVRAFLDRVDTFDEGAAPFWDLPRLDEDRALRGFERNRFRDKGALLFNAEYRYPIWDTWDGYLFWDEGQVFRNFSDVDSSRFEWSAGAGILFLSEKKFLMRIQFATSEEDQLFRLDLERSF